MQAPNHWNRQDQDREVRDDVDVARGHGNVDERDTVSLDQRIPCFTYRAALEDDEQRVGNAIQRPDGGDGVDSPAEVLVDTKYPVKENEDRQFGQVYSDSVEKRLCV